MTLLSTAILAGGLVGPVVVADAAMAATFTVNTFYDRADTDLADNICRTIARTCSLRAAIQQANATPGWEEIRLAGGTYRLGRIGTNVLPTSIDADQSRDLDVTDSVSIVGATGSRRSVIDGGRYARILEIGANSNPIVNLSNVTLTNGGESETPSFGLGGAMLVRAGSVSLHRVVVRDNVTTLQGSGIANAGTLSLFESTVDNNRNLSSLGGGGVTATGGGIFNYSSGRVTIDRSTITNNYALRGGGINNNFGDVTIVNSTISGNSARNSGGGIRNQGPGTGAQGILNISYSTVARNQANMSGAADVDRVGGGIANFGGQVNMGGTILAGNTDNRTTADRTPDCYSPTMFRFTSFRSNVIGLVSGPCIVRDTVWGEQLFDLVGRDVNAPLDPQFFELTWNGDAATHPLPYWSPAVDAASSGTSSTLFNCPATDQRGVTRPRDGNFDGSPVCDAGSYEWG